MCNHCPLTFSNNDSKVAHERTHQEKPLECAFCEMRFTAEFGLRRHQRIHDRQMVVSGAAAPGATSSTSSTSSSTTASASSSCGGTSDSSATTAVAT